MGKGGAIFNAGEVVVAGVSSFTRNTAAVRPVAHALLWFRSDFLKVQTAVKTS